MPENSNPPGLKPVISTAAKDAGDSARPVSPSLSASLSLTEQYQKLNATAEGLSSSEAEQRLKQYGWNDPVASQARSAVVEFFLLFTNPLVVILLIASLLSAILGDMVNAAII